MLKTLLKSAKSPPAAAPAEQPTHQIDKDLGLTESFVKAELANRSLSIEPLSPESLDLSFSALVSTEMRYFQAERLLYCPAKMAADHSCEAGHKSSPDSAQWNCIGQQDGRVATSIWAADVSVEELEPWMSMKSEVYKKMRKELEVMTVDRECCTKQGREGKDHQTKFVRTIRKYFKTCRVALDYFHWCKRLTLHIVKSPHLSGARKKFFGKLKDIIFQS